MFWHQVRFIALFLLICSCSSANAIILSAVNNNSLDAGDVYVVVPGGLNEDVDAFIDRSHEYNGATGAGMPSFLVGADYVQTANDDKTAGSLSVDVTTNASATLFLFVDNRVGDGNGNEGAYLGNVMPWTLDGSLGFTFADTGMNIGIDEGGGGVGPGSSIDQTSRIFAAQVSAGTVSLFEQNNGGSRNMYGIAATAGNTFNPFNVNNVIRTGGNDAVAPRLMLGEATTGITGTGLQEDALTFVDRNHQWQNIPVELIGADYIRIANDDRSASNFELSLDLANPSDVYLFIDDRVGDDDNGDGPSLGGGLMDWVAGLGFVDTGNNLGVDESADGDIDQFSSIYLLQNVVGNLVLEEQNNGSSRNMYGVAIVARPAIPEPMTGGLLALSLAALAARSRRRRVE